MPRVNKRLYCFFLVATSFGAMHLCCFHSVIRPIVCVVYVLFKFYCKKYASAVIRSILMRLLFVLDVVRMLTLIYHCMS